ncbi:MAG: hypothetical protein ACREJ3_13665, partial [Polyangiaceae bacterium]
MRVGVVAVLFALLVAAPARADGWLPHSSDATWTYQWTDSAYNTTPTNEIVTVKSSSGSGFTLGWTTDGANNPGSAPQSAGTVSFQQTTYGLVNTDWSSTPPPAAFPILCSSLTSCGNSLASAYYTIIWGSRAPVFFEPVLQGTSWSTTGAAANDVTSSNDYIGAQTIMVPAFSKPVTAAVVRSQITQAGALGDPYGSGIRTTWWVYGVGPVKVVFQHAGGTGAPVTTVMLQSTNQTATAPPSDVAYFPLQLNAKGTYRWTNKRHFKTPEVESYVVAQEANDTAIVNVNSVVGPIKVAGAYEFTTRLDGVTSVASSTKAASLAKMPPLGPASLPPSKRRHFFTPFDLMTFGFNPVLPAYPTAKTTWSSNASNPDFTNYGVTGTSRVVGVQTVKVPAGTFHALVVASVLKQPGFPFGSGTRTMWF